MPSVATAIAIAVSGGGFAVPTAGALLFGKIAVGVAVAIGTSVLAAALTKKPKLPDAGSFQQELRDRTITARQPVSPRRFVYGEIRSGGIYTFIHTTGSSNEFLHLVIVCAGHEIDAFTGLYFDGELIPVDGNGEATGTYAGFARVKYNLGTDDQEAFPDLVAEAPDKWTTAHRQRGCASAYVRLKYDGDKYPNGIPAITFGMRGKNDIYDPRTDTRGYSTNAALCVADYLSTNRGGLEAVYGDQILESDLIESANVCDELVAINNDSPTTFEDRYAVNGTFTLDKSPYDILLGLAGAMAGQVVAQGSLWSVQAGFYRAPVMTLTEGDFIGSISTSTLISRENGFNSVRGTFAGPDTDWQPDDFPAVSVPAYVTADNGVETWNDITLSYTSSPYAAQRIARVILEENRRQIVVSVPAKTKAYRLQPGDTVEITLARYGWTSKTFRVKSSALTLGDTVSVNLDLQETDANVYAWTTADQQEYEPAPTTDLPNPFNVGAPGVSVTDSIITTASGTPATVMEITLTAAADAFVTEYEVQYKLASQTEYILVGRSSGLEYDIENAIDGATYDIRARSINAVGAKSSFITIQYIVLGQLEDPPDITGFEIAIVGDVAYLSWNPVQVADLSHYQIRYSPLLTGATWGGASVLINQIGRASTSAQVVALRGTYLIKAVDFGGRRSVNAALVVTNVAGFAAINAVETVIEDSAFSGFKDRVSVNGGALVLSYMSDVFDVGDVFDLADVFLEPDGLESEGIYYFADEVDLSEVYTSRLSADVSVVGVNLTDNVFSYPDIFAVDDIFGVDAADWGFELQVRTSDDTLSNSPVAWGDWRQFVVGDYSARSYSFRAILTSNQYGVTPSVSRLRVTIDMPDRIVSEEDLTVTTSGRTITFPGGAYRALSGVAISAQGLATGDYYEITSKDENGFTVVFKDSAGNSVERTIDYVANGYGRVLA